MSRKGRPRSASTGLRSAGPAATPAPAIFSVAHARARKASAYRRRRAVSRYPQAEVEAGVVAPAEAAAAASGRHAEFRPIAARGTARTESARSDATASKGLVARTARRRQRLGCTRCPRTPLSRTAPPRLRRGDARAFGNTDVREGTLLLGHRASCHNGRWNVKGFPPRAGNQSRPSRRLRTATSHPGLPDYPSADDSCARHRRLTPEKPGLSNTRIAERRSSARRAVRACLRTRSIPPADDTGTIQQWKRCDRDRVVSSGGNRHFRSVDSAVRSRRSACGIARYADPDHAAFAAAMGVVPPRCAKRRLVTRDGAHRSDSAARLSSRADIRTRSRSSPRTRRRSR